MTIGDDQVLRHPYRIFSGHAAGTDRELCRRHARNLGTARRTRTAPAMITSLPG